MVSIKAEQGLVAFPLVCPGNCSTFKENAGPINLFPDRTTTGVLLSPDGIFHFWVCWCSSSQQLNVVKNFIDVNRYRLRVRTWPEKGSSAYLPPPKQQLFSCIFPVTALIFSRAQVRVQLCYHTSKDAVHETIFHSVSYSLGSNQL